MGQHSFPDIRIEDKLALRINEVCVATGICRTSVYELINEGKLRSVKVAGRRLVLRESLEQLLGVQPPEAA
jgi:excisionase family DNA binding protein